MGVIESEESQEVIKRRPIKADMTPEFVFWAASHFISQAVIAEFFGISQPAVSQRFSREPLRTAYAQGRAAAKMNLHAAQYRNAVLKDNTVAQIWLGKQYLDQRDAVHEVKNDLNVKVSYLCEWGGGGLLEAPEVPEIVEGEVEEGEDDD